MGEGAAEPCITEKRKKAIWNWKLIPQSPGQQELKLAVTIIEKDGEAVRLPTKNICVIFFAEKESFMDVVEGVFKGDNIKWILSAILMLIFLAWVTKKIKYKHKNSRPSINGKKYTIKSESSSSD